MELPKSSECIAAAYDVSDCSHVGSEYFGGSAGAGVCHEGCGNIWVRSS